MSRRTTISYWNAFLPIGKARAADEPGLDPMWAASMGIDIDALQVLRRVRRVAIPTVRKLERGGLLVGFSLLIHDRASGVPCPPEDDSAYVHLQLAFRGKFDVRRALPAEWVYIRQVDLNEQEVAVQEAIAQQSAWYLQLVEAGADLSDVDLLRHVGQTLHFYANMAQMMVR